jgi:hypothetical protein
MGRRGGAVILRAVSVLLLLAVVACAPPVGELGLLDSRVVKQHSRVRFDPEAWHAGDPATRGAMVADLLRRHRFRGRDRDSVAAFLGPSTCYAGQEYFNCFRLELGGRQYQLELITDHEGVTREVVSVGLSSR